MKPAVFFMAAGIALCGQAMADTLTINTFDRSTQWQGLFISADSVSGYVQIRFGSYSQRQVSIQGQTDDLVPFGIFTIFVDGDRYQRCALQAISYKPGKGMVIKARCAFLG